MPRFVAIGIEGTGLSPTNDRIIEFAVLCLPLNDSPPDSLYFRVNPGVRISPYATRVHSYTDAAVAGLPPFSSYANLVSNFLANAVVIVHKYRSDTTRYRV